MPTKLNSGLIAHICVWVALSLVLAVISKMAANALFFNGIPPVPLRANPTLLSLGIVLVPFCLLLLYVAGRYSSINKIALGTGALCTAAICTGVILIALHPGPGSLVARDLVQQPEADANSSVFAFPVFFRNGESVLTPQEEDRLVDVFAVFRSCEAGTLRVRGFASSAPFAINSDALNLKLANERTASVKRILERLLGINVVGHQWTSFENMIGNRRLRDVTLEGKRIDRIEGYNRRVEIFWSDSMCLKIENMFTPSPDGVSSVGGPLTPRKESATKSTN